MAAVNKLQFIIRYAFHQVKTIAGLIVFGRDFKASKFDRSTYNWRGSSRDINQSIKWSWSDLLGKSREQAKNNSYFHGWLGHSRANIPGPTGFKLQSKCTDPNGQFDATLNDKIEASFAEWCKKDNCTVHRELSLLRVQWLATDQLKRDGEILMRKVIDPAINKFGFALELFEVEDLDHNLNLELKNGNVVIMGVEYNEWKRPVNYYLKKKSLLQPLGNYTSSQPQDYNVYPAEEIIHGFDKTHPRQVRGIPESASVLVEMYKIDRWENSSLNNAEQAARNVGFISRKYGDVDSLMKNPGNENASTRVPAGTTYEFKENVFTFLDDGETFIPFDPKFPLEQHESFVKSVGRKIATGIRMGFNKLFNNYESVNFSSLRSSELTEQRNWTLDQSLFSEIFFSFYRDWLAMAILSGQLKGLSISRIDEYSKPFWQGTRWDWVDPVKDVTAVKLALEENLTTLTEELSKKGKDFNDVIELRKTEITKLLELQELKNKLDKSTSVEVDIQDTADNNDDNSRTHLKIIGG